MYNLSYVSKRNKTQTELDVQKNWFSEKKLNILEFPNAIVASRKYGGPGLFYSSGYIKESDFTNSVEENRSIDDTNVKYIDEEVVFIGTIAKIYGHMITDNLKHLWFLLEHNIEIKKLKFVFVKFSEDGDIPDIFYHLLKLLGKDKKDIIQVDEIVRFKKVYLPEQCFFCVPGGELEQSGDRYYTKEYKDIIATISSKISVDNTYEKVYFTRTALRNDFRDFGEKNLEKVFRKKGFEIIAPEMLKFDDQISILKGCHVFATTQGSISLNSIFCNVDTEVIIINKQNYNTPYQLAISQARGGNTIIIDANCSTLNSRKMPWVGPFFMYNTKEFCEWAQIKYRGIPILGYMLYLILGSLRAVKTLINRCTG